MRNGITTVLVLAIAFTSAGPVAAEIDRPDVIWARQANGPITLDGVLDEADWAKAETKVIQYAQNAGIPGSGWRPESGLFNPTDPTTATLKLLRIGNELYLGATIADSSVGGSQEFNRFDGLLMALKDHNNAFSPKPPAEYFYSWWYADSLTPDPQPPGQSPAFVGAWADWPPGSPRSAEQIAAWDAVTVVHGLSNSDATVDTGYTVEMRFNVADVGYDFTQSGGDIVEWNISIYDCDWFWPYELLKFTSNRVWWQSPWGNASWYNEVRVYGRADVTVDSGPAPAVGPEVVIGEISGTAPTIDGALTEPIWSDPSVYSFDLRYGDEALRETYPAVGRWRSGQFQPEVNGSQAFLLDPGDATVKIFHQGDMLYMGFDVRDLVVQYHPDIDRWDGVLLTLTEYSTIGNDNQLLTRRVSFQVNTDGSALAQDYLTTLVTGGDADVAISLNTGTTVDTLGMNADNGYTAELAIDLKGLGYPAGLGDGRLFLGVNLLDGDSFIPTTDSYGNRTWWFREFEGECCPVWGYLAPFAVGVDEIASVGEAPFLRTFPNPSPRPAIEYSLDRRSAVTMEVFDVAGRLVERRALGVQGPGVNRATFDGAPVGSGVYLVRLKLGDLETGAETVTGYGKMVVVK